MLDLSLFRNPSFCTSLVSGFSVFVSVAGVLLLFPFYLQLVAKLEQQQIGMVMAITPIMLGIWGLFSGMLADRFGARLLTILGLASVVTGYFTLSWLGVSSGPAAFVLLQVSNGFGHGELHKCKQRCHYDRSSAGTPRYRQWNAYHDPHRWQSVGRRSAGDVLLLSSGNICRPSGGGNDGAACEHCSSSSRSIPSRGWNRRVGIDNCPAPGCAGMARAAARFRCNRTRDRRRLVRERIVKTTG